MLIDQLQAILSPLAAGGAWYAMNTTEPPVFPFIVWQRITSLFENTLDGPTDMQNTRVQIDIFSRDIAQAESISNALDAAMQAASDAKTLVNVPLSSQDLYEFDARCHRISRDFSVWSTD